MEGSPLRVTALQLGEAFYLKSVEMALELGGDLEKSYGVQPGEHEGMYLLELITFAMFPMDLILHANRDNQFGAKAGAVRTAFQDALRDSCRAQGWTEPQVKQLDTFVTRRLDEYAGSMRGTKEGAGGDALQQLGFTACRNITGAPSISTVVAAHLSMHFAETMQAFQDIGRGYEID